jgi:hypothetical protein
LQPEKDKPPGVVHTASIWISNNGREAATEVELTFNFPPQNYNVWPARPYDKFNSDDHRHTLRFCNIAPGEFLQIELISIQQELPSIVSFRSKEGVGKSLKWLIPLAPGPRNMVTGAA